MFVFYVVGDVWGKGLDKVIVDNSGCYKIVYFLEVLVEDGV